MKIYIYKIYFPISNKCYIGQTNNLEGRLIGHISCKSLIGFVLNKYDDWEISILHICNSRQEANRIEIEEIRNHNSKVPNGYNLTKGGEGIGDYWVGKKNPHSINHINNIRAAIKKRRSYFGKNNPVYGKGGTFKGKKHSKEARKKMSEAQIGNKKSLGHKHSKEARKKMSEAQIGNKNSLGCKRSKRTILKQQIGRLKFYINKLVEEI